jgi:hypothetical protein
MSKITDLDAIGSIDPDNDFLYVVDGSDNSQSDSGTSKKTNAYSISRCNIPTAAELSGNGLLQAYINKELARANRVGPIYLPKGDITIHEPLLIENINGCVIQGAGPILNSNGTTNQWDSVSAFQGTRIRLIFGSSDPVIRLKNTVGVTLSNMSLQGNSAGINYTTTSGYGGALFNRLENMSIMECVVGIDVGSTDSNINGGNLVLDQIRFFGCDTGLKTNDASNTNITFQGQCHWGQVGICIHLIRGGNVFVFGANCGLGVYTFLKIGSDSIAANAGFNVMPCGVYGLKIETDNNNKFPIIVDASDSDGRVLVKAECINVRHDSYTDGSSYRPFKLPTASGTNSQIEVGLSSFPPGTLTTPA